MQESSVTSLVVQWLRFCTSNTGVQVLSLVRELKIPYAVLYRQKNKKVKAAWFIIAPNWKLSKCSSIAEQEDYNIVYQIETAQQ